MSLRPAAVALDNTERAGSFLATARLFATHKGSLVHMARAVEDGNYSPRVTSIIKQAVTAGSLSSADKIVPYDSAVSAFFESLQFVGTFDKILADGAFRRVPIKGRGVVVTGAATGNKIGEGMVKPVSSLELDGDTLAPKKSLAVLAVTNELLKLGAPGTSELFNNELRTAVAAATDAEFLSALYAATTPTGSAGSTLANIVTDLGVLLSAVTSGANSKLYLILDSVNAKKLALKASSIGTPAFINFGPNGGQIIPGVTALVSDSLPSGAVLLLDASQIMADSGTIKLDIARHASIQFETAPDSPTTTSTVPVNMWQHDIVALKAERDYAYSVMRSTAVASISGASY